MRRHLILVGLPGSGKSTVGRRVAELLPTDFTDTDEAVEAEAGRSIAAIFERMGEASFRRLERAAMERALFLPPHVISAGAGWISQPGNHAEAMLHHACVVYLQLSPASAASRLRDDDTRPLLAGGDRGVRLTALLEERERWYLRASVLVDAQHEVEMVTTELADAARRLAGW